MSDIAKAIDDVVKRGLAPTLNAQGFRKHTRTFVRDAESAQQIVNVQASQTNQGAEGRFTLNLGVYFPAVARRHGPVASGAYPKEYESTYRERIGALMPERSDHWWEITPATDLQKMAEEVAEAYRRFAVPWLETMLDLAAVLPMLRRRGDSLTAASAALELGRMDEATEIVENAYMKASPEFAREVRRFAERQGIDLR